MRLFVSPRKERTKYTQIIMSELKRTQLYDAHVKAGATMVDFGGWEMPIQYPEGIVAEHLFTRHSCWASSPSTCSPGTAAASST